MRRKRHNVRQFNRTTRHLFSIFVSCVVIQCFTQSHVFDIGTIWNKRTKESKRFVQINSEQLRSHCTQYCTGFRFGDLRGKVVWSRRSLHLLLLESFVNCERRFERVRMPTGTWATIYINGQTRLISARPNPIRCLWKLQEYVWDSCLVKITVQI